MQAFLQTIRIATCLALSIALWLPFLACAEEVSAVNAASSVGAASSVNSANSISADSSPADTTYSIDPTRDYLSGGLENWAKSIDSFFGDYRNYQESNDSVIQIHATQVLGSGGLSTREYGFDLKISLPNTEKKMQFLIETNPEEKTAENQTKVKSPLIKPAPTPTSIAAALRFEKSEAERWHFTTDGGIQLAGLASTPFVRARLSLSRPLEHWRLNVAESVFWFSTIGIGESTLIDFERPLSERHLFRASSNATWLKNSNNFDLNQSFSVYHTVNERTAVLYQISVSGVTQPQTQVSDYVLLMRYRYRLHREWMFLDISPQLHFPQLLDYHPSLYLGIRLEFLFDKSR